MRPGRAWQTPPTERRAEALRWPHPQWSAAFNSMTVSPELSVSWLSLNRQRGLEPKNSPSHPSCSSRSAGQPINVLAIWPICSSSAVTRTFAPAWLQPALHPIGRRPFDFSNARAIRVPGTSGRGSPACVTAVDVNLRPQRPSGCRGADARGADSVSSSPEAPHPAVVMAAPNSRAQAATSTSPKVNKVAKSRASQTGLAACSRLTTPTRATFRQPDHHAGRWRPIAGMRQ
jgi:hypothetical protein